MTSKSTTWIPIANTPDLECGPLIAVYHRTHRSGHAEYRVYERTLPVTARGLPRALNVGGLPGAALTEQLITRADAMARERSNPH